MLSVALVALGTAFAQDPDYDRTTAIEDAVEKPDTDLTADFGFTFTSGNAYILAANGGVKFAHKWQANRFAMNAGANLNLAKIDADANGTLDAVERDQKVTFTSQRIYSDARYDRFFGKMNSLFVSGGFERDVFAGLNWRFNEQLGYSRLLVATEATKVNLEVGLAYTEENFVTGVDADGNPLNDKVLDAHYLAGRVYFGFSHSFNAFVSISDDVEMIENFFTPTDFRLNNTFALNTKMSDRFSVKLSHRLAFDNLPVLGFQKVDQTTMVTLVASIF